MDKFLNSVGLVVLTVFLLYVSKKFIFNFIDYISLGYSRTFGGGDGGIMPHKVKGTLGLFYAILNLILSLCFAILTFVSISFLIKQFQ